MIAAEMERQTGLTEAVLIEPATNKVIFRKALATSLVPPAESCTVH